MRKPAFCIFCGLCILTSFSLLTVNVRGGGGGGGEGYQISIAYCLFSFFHELNSIRIGIHLVDNTQIMSLIMRKPDLAYAKPKVMIIKT